MYLPAGSVLPPDLAIQPSGHVIGGPGTAWEPFLSAFGPDRHPELCCSEQGSPCCIGKSHRASGNSPEGSCLCLCFLFPDPFGLSSLMEPQAMSDAKVLELHTTSAFSMPSASQVKGAHCQARGTLHPAPPKLLHLSVPVARTDPRTRTLLVAQDLPETHTSSWDCQSHPNPSPLATPPCSPGSCPTQDENWHLQGPTLLTGRALSLPRAQTRPSHLPTGRLANTPWTHLFGVPLALGNCCWGWEELSMGLVNTPLKESPGDAGELPGGAGGVRSQGVVRVGTGKPAESCGHLPDDVASRSPCARRPAKGKEGWSEARFAGGLRSSYFILPLTIANKVGWQVLQVSQYSRNEGCQPPVPPVRCLLHSACFLHAPPGKQPKVTPHGRLMASPKSSFSLASRAPVLRRGSAPLS